jgi:hypothetical protein
MDSKYPEESYVCSFAAIPIMHVSRALKHKSVLFELRFAVHVHGWLMYGGFVF